MVRLLDYLRAYRSGFLLITGAVIGVLFWGGFNGTLAATNTEQFCIGCHEMRDNVYQEYTNSVHFNNASGVKASCPDCHVPKTWAAMVWRKVGASNELWHHFTTDISSPDAFNAERHRLANYVWQQMQRQDSLECRNCHQFSAMLLAKQRAPSRWAHQYAKRQSNTCIDCHKGIAHRLPPAFVLQEHERVETQQIPCASCHADMYAVLQQNWE